MEPDSWNRLSVSSRRALQWAHALARCRDERQGQDPSSSFATPFDLLVGMLLEHPEDAEPRRLLDHFHLTAGQLLPPDQPIPPAEALERQVPYVSPDGPPPMDQETAVIVQQGTDLGLSSGQSEVAPLRALFAAMLETSNPVASAFGELLVSRGSSLGEIARLLHDYVEKPGKSDGGDFGRYLEERYPFQPKPIDIPNYKADHGAEQARDGDLVDIRAEVDAFAYLLASRGLSPPLAVGLFGDWGSGKSFFMDALSDRIAQLTTSAQVRDRPQCEVPFWKRVIQIKFNAWHYVEGELWASLVDHIFNELRVGRESDSLVEVRRQYWLEKLDNTRAKMVRLESRRSLATQDLASKQQQADLLRRQRDAGQAELERLRARARSGVLIRSSLDEVNAALAPLLVSVGAPSADEVFGKLDEARAELKRGRVLLDQMWREPGDRRWLLLALVGVPLLVWALSQLDLSGVTTAFAGLSAMAGAGLKLLGRATGLLKSRLDALEKVRQRVTREVETARSSLSGEIDKAERNIREADDRLNEVIAEQQRLTTDLKRIQAQLEQVTPARVLNDFVAERVGAGDYRKHLGIPALIQRDFRQLSDLVAEQNDHILEDASGQRERNANYFNRIILYIDDLDRCPDERVVEVLQAVHLLLAFKLFVVVVAVDSRWLRHALTKHFEALTLTADGSRAATPDDYLEKIFQIPFWIQPIGDDARRNIVQGLLRGHLASGQGDEAAVGGGDRPTLGEPQRAVLERLDPAKAPPNLEAASLSITAAELRFLDGLAPLLGETPRSTKRFVNLYQLIRIIYRLDPGGANNALLPPEHELLALVLALGEGLPALGPRVLKAATAATPDTGFATLLADIRPLAAAPALARLEAWLDGKTAWQQLPAGRIAGALRKVDRFLFRVGTAQDGAPEYWGSC